MAYVLPMSASSPLRDSYHHNTGFTQSCSSIGSVRSNGTVQHKRIRSLSGSSLSSLTSLWAPPFRRHYHQQQQLETEFERSSSHSGRTILTTRLSDQESLSRSLSRRRTSFASAISSSRGPSNLNGNQNFTSPEGVDLRPVDDAPSGADLYARESNEDDVVETVEQKEARERKIVEPNSTLSAKESESSALEDKESHHSTFRRWASTLRRRKQQQPVAVRPRTQRWTLDDFEKATISPNRTSHKKHRSTNSYSSSIGFVTAVKSASATIASTSASIATASRRKAKWRRGNQQSSLVSNSDPRPSMESQRSVIDEAAKQRSRKRRDKLEELIRTEEDYLADVRALSQAYFNILGNEPTAVGFARSTAQKNISEIIQLHDDLLGHLHQVVPFAEYDQKTASRDPNIPRAHTRWHSVDVVPTRTTPNRSKLSTIRNGRRSLNISRSSDDEQALLRCSPQIVAAVAKAFSTSMHRFALYEEYGANFCLVQRDIEGAQQGIIAWADFDRAIEALSIHVNPVKSREANRKKAMTMKDLLIKPIQRLPRYELLFSDLCKLTPVCDDPDSNGAIQSLLVQLNHACQRMDKAKDDPARARQLQTTWMLGDRLTFSNQIPRSVFLQLLGQVQLCGCLFVAYRSKDQIKGSYMICILFESTLLLATADNDQARYTTLAGIALANATMAESDNGKGLQCHTAPHSWKVVFEHSASMYEVILAACSATEAEVWKRHISLAINTQSQGVSEGKRNVLELQSPLISGMRSIGKAFGKPGSFVRRMSVQRTATVRPTSDLNQVIIKNTQAVKDPATAGDNNASNTSSLHIPRSQSVATPSHVPTLAPRRAERARLESILSDVWSKDILPYPGVAPRRSDPIRASANHVIRKFSMASITSNFSSSKRSTSYTSIGDRSSSLRKEDIPPAVLATKASKTRVAADAPRSSKSTKPTTTAAAIVDFHSAPEAFLPADFELHNPGTKRNKKSALRSFTMTMERPFSPLLPGGGGAGHDSSPAPPAAARAGLSRAQSVRDVGCSSSTVPSALRDNRAAAAARLKSAPRGPLDDAAQQQHPQQSQPVYSVVTQDRTRGQANKLQKPNPSEAGAAGDSAVDDRAGGGNTGEGEEEVVGGKTAWKSKSRSKLWRLFG